MERIKRVVTLLITKCLIYVYVEMCYSAYYFGTQHPVYLNTTGDLNLDPYDRHPPPAYQITGTCPISPQAVA